MTELDRKDSMSQNDHDEDQPEAPFADETLPEDDDLPFDEEDLDDSHVNLRHADTPADIYQVVADKTIAKLEACVACAQNDAMSQITHDADVEQKTKSAQIAQDDEVSDAHPSPTP